MTVGEQYRAWCVLLDVQNLYQNSPGKWSEISMKKIDELVRAEKERMARSFISKHFYATTKEDEFKIFIES